MGVVAGAIYVTYPYKPFRHTKPKHILYEIRWTWLVLLNLCGAAVFMMI